MMSAYSISLEQPKKPHVQYTQREEKLSKLKEIENNNENKGVAWVSFGLDKDF